MSVAFLSAQRSKDPNKQVGAVIVGPGKIICGVGYNGFPRGCGDTELPWAKKSREDDPMDTKYAYVCHAEMNAIMNKNAQSLDGASLYVTMYPCNECAKLVIQSGIKEVVFFEGKEIHASNPSRDVPGDVPGDARASPGHLRGVRDALREPQDARGHEVVDVFARAQRVGERRRALLRRRRARRVIVGLVSLARGDAASARKNILGHALQAMLDGGHELEFAVAAGRALERERDAARGAADESERVRAEAAAFAPTLRVVLPRALKGLRDATKRDGEAADEALDAEETKAVRALEVLVAERAPRGSELRASLCAAFFASFEAWTGGDAADVRARKACLLYTSPSPRDRG